MADSETWLLKSPQDLLNEYHKAHNIWRKDVSVAVYIIDSNMLLLLVKDGKYCVPEYTFTPPPGLVTPLELEIMPDSMEVHAFKILQPYIETKTLRQVRFLDIAFDAPLIEEKQRGPDDKTLHLSLIVQCRDGKTVKPNDIKQITGGKFEDCDFFSLEEVTKFLQPDRVSECRRAILRFKNYAPRMIIVLRVGTKETPAFKLLCSRWIAGELR